MSKYPKLDDPSWLRVELAVGTTVAEIARQVGAQRRVVVAALRRHEIEVPPRRMPRLDRAADAGLGDLDDDTHVGRTVGR